MAAAVAAAAAAVVIDQTLLPLLPCHAMPSSPMEGYLQQVECAIHHASTTGSSESSRLLDEERQLSVDGMASVCLELLCRRGWGVAVLVIPPPLRMRIILDVMAAAVAAAAAACDCIGLAASREGSCLHLQW